MDRKIRTVAEALGVEAAGRVLAEKVHAGMAAVVDRTAAIADRKRVLFVLSLTDGRPMGAGRDTAADAIITLAGGEHALPRVSGYKPVSAAATAPTAPDDVLLIRRPDGGQEPAHRGVAGPEVVCTRAKSGGGG